MWWEEEGRRYSVEVRRRKGRRKGGRKVRELGGWKERKVVFVECGTFERCAWRYRQTNLTGGEGKKRTDA